MTASAQARIRKRDGREVPFDQGKIVEAIFRAAHSVGGGDRLLAEELASVVAMFLQRQFGERTPSIDDVSDLIEKVLVETGHARTAKAFILERDRRARIRDALLVRRGDAAAAGRPPSLTVDARARETVSPWSKAKIMEALLIEADLQPAIAEAIASEVERRVFASGMTRISTTLVRALVDNELFERGLAPLINRQAVVGLPRFDLDRLLRAGPPRLPAAAAPGGGVPIVHGAEAAPDVDAEVVRATWTQYSLMEVHPPEAVEAHVGGSIHVFALGAPGRFHALEVDVGSAGARLAPEQLRFERERAEGLAAERVALLGVGSALRDEFAAPAFDGPRLARRVVEALAVPIDGGRQRPAVDVELPALAPAALAPGDSDGEAVRARWRSFLAALPAALGAMRSEFRLPRIVVDVAGLGAEAALEREREWLEAAVLSESVEDGFAFRVGDAISGIAARVSPVHLRVDLDLAQAAFRAGRGSDDAIAHARAALAAAAAACEARMRFVNGLFGAASPRERLKRLAHGDATRVGGGRCEIGMVGLDAACRIACDGGMLASERAREFALALVGALARETQEQAAARRLPLVLRFSGACESVARFGRLDFERHPRGRDLHGAGLLAHDGERYLYFAPLGPPESDCDVAAAAALESRLRALAPHGSLPSYHSQAADRLEFLRRLAAVPRTTAKSVGARAQLDPPMQKRR